MASPRSGATESTVMRAAARLSSVTGIEFVTTISSTGDDLMRAIAGPAQALGDLLAGLATLLNGQFLHRHGTLLQTNRVDTDPLSWI